MADKVRVGIIGTSWWVDMLYVPSLISHAQAEVVAVCGRNVERAREIADKLDGAQVFADYRELIASGDVDAVIVASPDDLHFEMTMAALEAGLHVLCEKPLANTAVEAKAMVDKANAAGVKHMVMFTWRWQPNWRFVKQLVDDGYIGRCHQARLQFLIPVGDDSYHWRKDGARTNGIIADLGSHMIDFAQLLIGEVDNVSAQMQRGKAPVGPDGQKVKPAADAAFFSLGFQNGAQAQVHVSAREHLGESIARIRVELYGDKGSIEAEQVFFGSQAGATIIGISGEDTEFHPLLVPAAFTEGLDAADVISPYAVQSVGPRLFIDAIVNDTVAYPGFEVGAQVQRVVDAALKSDASGQPVGIT